MRVENTTEEVTPTYADTAKIVQALEDDGITAKNAWNQQHNEHWNRANPGFYYGYDDYVGKYSKFVTLSEDATDAEKDTYYNTILQPESVLYQTEHNLPPMDVYIPFITYTEEETIIYNEIRPDLYTYVDEMQAAFITGIKDIDEEWDAYLEQLEILRLSEFESIVQSAYDRMYK